MLRDLAPRFCQIPVLVAMDLLLSQRFMKDSQAALSHGFPLRDTLISMHIAIRDRNDAPGRVRPAAAIVPCAMRPSWDSTIPDYQQRLSWILSTLFTVPQIMTHTPA